jgi:hypothetical protein
MKAPDVLELQDWVITQKGWIRSEENPTLKQIRAKAEFELRYKCPENNIRGVMEYLDIPIRRSKADAKVVELEARCDQYRRVLLTIAAFVNLPDEIAVEVREQFNIDEELLGALRLNKPQMVAKS